jgi:folate-binding protein YgfZ
VGAFLESVQMPEQPVTVELDAQYRQLRQECGLLDLSARGKLLVTGPDAADYLQGQVTNDVEALAPGRGCYAALLDRKAHIQADMRILRRPEPDGDFWIDTEPGAAARAARSHLQTYKIGRDVEVEDLGAERAILALIGPAAAETAGVPAPPAGECRAAVVAGVECLVAGTADGLDLVCDAGEAAGLRESLVASGAAEVDFGAVEILRIEGGRPRFGADMGPECMPAEAGIVDAAVSFTKGCYIGQEPVARLHHRGRPNRRLRGLVLDRPAEPGAPLRLDGKDVGVVGSACVSPALGPIALAIVRREAEAGAELAVGEDGVTARVVDLPFG